MTWWAPLGIIASALIGMPLFLVIALASLVAFVLAGTDAAAVAVEIYRMASAPTLVSIPLFTLAGFIMAESKTPERLVRLAQSLFGSLPGGVAIVSLLVCAFFTAFTGASGVTIIALGGLLYPILQKEGYTDRFSLGLISTSGSLGLLFPPSLPLILYGLVARVDIEKLFRAGLLPGIILILVLACWSLKNGRKAHKEPFSWARLRQALWDSRYEIPLPFLILSAIYRGWATVTETAALTAFYAILVQCVLYRDIKWKAISGIIKESMSLVGAILLILCCALGFTSYLISEEVPLKVLEFLRHFIQNKYVFLLFLNIFLLIVGSFMDIFSAIVVVVPLILPIANDFGIHPLHLAIIFLTNLEIGYLTPPVGINLFISSFRFKRPITELYSASLPFLVLLFLALMLITYAPGLTLFLT